MPTYHPPKQEPCLLLLLKQGDERALTTLFESTFSHLVRYVFGFVKDRQVSQDIVQDAFVKLWDHRSNIDPSAEPKALLFTICRRLALNELRSIAYDQEARAHFWEKIQECRNVTQDELEYSEMEKLAKMAVSLLPPRQQEVFLMSREEGLSHQEIAGALNISKHTVNNLLVKAVKSVKSALREIGVSVVLALLCHWP